MKSFNANNPNKAKTGENGAGKLSLTIDSKNSHLTLNFITLAEAIQMKPAAPTEGAASMSQVAA